MLCFFFGHRYNTSDVAAAARCTRCGELRHAINWPHGLPTPKKIPPMPKVKPAGSGVRVENVTLSPKAFAIAQLETEKETIDRMILKTSREIEAYKQRMRELYHRRDITQRSMHALINTRD